MMEAKLPPAELTTPNGMTDVSSENAPAKESSGDVDANGGGESLEIGVGSSAPKKKKRKTKKKSSKKPTGFEEYVVEGPMTPEEVTEENKLYDPEKPFEERMELCIQRYRARKRWDPTRIKMFGGYLIAGGVKTGQKMWQGMDTRAMKDAEMDAQEIHEMVATDYITGGRGEEGDEEWAVDFEYVVRGYLSWKVPYDMSYLKDEELVLATQLVKNFLNYVVYHNVAPEHIDNIKAAMKICDDAEVELVCCSQVSAALPGRFNTAASVVFGGQPIELENPSWLTLSPGSELARLAEEYTWERGNAQNIYGAAVDILGGGRIAKEAKFVKKEFMSVEVVEISMRPIVKDEGGEFFSGINTLGVLKVKPVILEEDGIDKSEMAPPPDEVIEIWLERRALQYCFVGMKIEASINRLSNGINFIDSVTGVFCKFFVRLEDPSSQDEEVEEA